MTRPEKVVVRHKKHQAMQCGVWDEGKTYFVGYPLDLDTDRFLGGVATAALWKGDWEVVMEEAADVPLTDEVGRRLRGGKL